MLNLFTTALSITVLLTSHRVHGIDLLVQTNVGLIKGLKATDGQYSMFMGIPYAAINESNPFGPSSPFRTFNETFEAYDDSTICPQFEELNSTVIGTLECLRLNVYVPNSITTDNPLPVLVWIHGGAFSIGDAGRYFYGPKFLIQHEIILVTLNYRLGPYGFMCHGTPDIPGNQGLKDQLLALKWIKENIASFGGNPNKITLFGESAGGISIDHHFLLQQEKLFNNIILQSGTSFNPGWLNEGSNEGTLKLASHLGFVTDHVDEAVSFLSKISPHLVITAASEINYRFVPCIEKGNNADKFISEYPINMDIPKAKNTAILIGHNDDERLATYVNRDGDYLAGLNLFYNNLKAEFNLGFEELNYLEGSVRRFYLGDEKITVDSRVGLTDFDSDFTYNHPTQRIIHKYLDNDADNVFYYVFSYNGDRNFMKKRMNITIGSAAHADEIGYLFDISYMTDPPSNDDQLVIDRITTMWANFVKYSNPTPAVTNLLPIKWEPVKRYSLNYLNIDINLSLGTRPFRERLAFWDLIFDFYYTYIKGYKSKDLPL